LFESFGNGNTGYISVITVAELSAGASLSPLRDAMVKTEQLLSHVEVIELTEAVAFHGGKLFAGLSKKGKKIEFNDCLIAATACSLGLKQIVTRNCNHFTRIDGLDPVVPEDLVF